MINDRIAKQKLNVVLLIDTSTSMRGRRIEQVNTALRDIKKYLADMQMGNSNVDFYITVITFSTDAEFLNNDLEKNVNAFNFTDIKAKGWSNLHLAYEKLDVVLRRQSQGGIMPDFGGMAPILILLTDGHPTGNEYADRLKALQEKSWFRVALKYGIAIELNDSRTINVLREFVGSNGDVIQVYDSNLLQKIIKIIVLTASKVKSQSASVHSSSRISVTKEIQQEVQNAITEVDDWEW